MADQDLILIDEPRLFVRRLTLNRPDKRNALSNNLRAALFAALEAADKDPAVRVIVLRGAGSCFSAGYICPSTAATRSCPSTPPPAPASGRAMWSRAVSASGTWPSR
jgi:enoyl-CoA hydratase